MTEANRPTNERVDIVADRVSGDIYPVIARRYGISITMCRYICKQAVKRGIVTARQIRWNPDRIPRRRLPEEAYRQRWLKRVKRNTVVNATGCWIWQGFKHAKGYGGTSYRGVNIAVHRAMYKVTRHVALREEQFVCHTCDNRACCNPAHLWLGDNSKNQLDASRKGRHQEKKRTHCIRGHEFTPENTYYKPLTSGRLAGSRMCKLCHRIRYRLALGWSEEEAIMTPVIPPGQRTKRRYVPRGVA